MHLYSSTHDNNDVISIFRCSQVLCKAAANVSGDVPSKSPGGMSQYEQIIEILTTLFPVWVCLSFC